MKWMTDEELDQEIIYLKKQIDPDNIPESNLVPETELAILEELKLLRAILVAWYSDGDSSEFGSARQLYDEAKARADK